MLRFKCPLKRVIIHLPHLRTKLVIFLSFLCQCTNLNHDMYNVLQHFCLDSLSLLHSSLLASVTYSSQSSLGY
ncbi:hypothetical protein MRGR3_1187 [Staphylococcus aureus subsp. aureus MRGR3]|nr:hypothetical protein MRGR3_1187 [Staphylococcus aureus subsp. aureus MRGR3]